jgi:hypothetical protein
MTGGESSHDRGGARTNAYTHWNLIFYFDFKPAGLAPASERLMQSAREEIIRTRTNPVGIDAAVTNHNLVITTQRDVDVYVKAQGNRATIKETAEVGASSRHTN